MNVKEGLYMMKKKGSNMETKIYKNRVSALRRKALFNGHIERIQYPINLTTCGNKINDYVVRYKVTWYKEDKVI